MHFERKHRPTLWPHPLYPLPVFRHVGSRCGNLTTANHLLQLPHYTARSPPVLLTLHRTVLLSQASWTICEIALWPYNLPCDHSNMTHVKTKSETQETPRYSDLIWSRRQEFICIMLRQHCMRTDIFSSVKRKKGNWYKAPQHFQNPWLCHHRWLLCALNMIWLLTEAGWVAWKCESKWADCSWLFKKSIKATKGLWPWWTIGMTDNHAQLRVYLTWYGSNQ